MRRRIARRGSGITKNGDEFAGDEREIVLVLNVFKTSVDTINASSITSDMTIGANLNGGSLTLGGTSINIGNVNSVTNFSSGTINASNFKLYSTNDGTNRSVWLDTIGTTITPQLVLGYNNASQVFIGSPNTPLVVIGGDKGNVKIANDGLSATGKVLIANGTNAVGSEMYLGSSTLGYTSIRGVTVNLCDNGGTVNIANNGLPAYGSVNICAGANGTGAISQMGSNTLSTMYLRAGDILINDGNNSNYKNNGNIWLGNTFGSGNITINKPLTPGYSYPVAANRIGEVKVNTTRLFTTATSISGQNLCAITLDYAGVYMMQFNAQIYFPGSPMTGSYVALYVTGGYNVDLNLYNSNIGTTSILPGPAPNNFYYGFGNTWIVRPNTGLAYYYITSINLPIGTVIDFVYLCAVRIA